MSKYIFSFEEGGLAEAYYTTKGPSGSKQDPLNKILYEIQKHKLILILATLSACKVMIERALWFGIHR